MASVRVAVSLLFLLVPVAGFAADSSFCPFVIPAIADSHSVVAVVPEPAIAVDSPRIMARDGHFYVGDRRVRFWGVNLIFASDFPAHGDAEQLAIRLSQAGVNCVRFHHMDTESWPNGIWDKTDSQKLSEEALDRLDYLLAKLAERGICADINLHVGRNHSRELGLPVNPEESYDKTADIFTPQLVEAQKKYARELLGHVNKYRGVRIADDPASAIVEINNEDSLFMWGAAQHLRALPKYYADVLRGKFISYLNDRYGTNDRLREVWGRGALPLGDNMLADGEMATVGKEGSAWILEQHAGAAAQAAAIAGGGDGTRIEIKQVDPVSWHLQFQQQGLKLHSGQFYTLRFAARSDKPRAIQFGVSQSHDPWGNMGLSESVKLTPEWTAFTESFVATQDESQARLSFSLSNDGNAVEFRKMLLAPGGRDGLEADESLEAGNIAVFKMDETEERDRDTWRFLTQTEKDFYDGMRNFVKQDLGCRAMVTGTIVFGGLGMYAQSDMDFIDGHSYWQHPRFPGKPWDMGNWLVKQSAMVDSPASATLFGLAAERMAGKPYTVTEYNHPAPNDFQAECVPMLASFAAAQDWDGVFLFDYGPVPNADHLDGFFGVGSNPAKWGFMAAGAYIFRQDHSARLATLKTVGLSSSATTQPSDEMIGLQSKHNLNMLEALGEAGGVHWQDLLESRIGVKLDKADSKIDEKINRPHLAWRTDGIHGVYQADSDYSMVWVGSSGLSSADTAVELSGPTFAAIMLASMDGQPLFAGKRMLLAACGRCENTGMVFSHDRETVGRNWGTGPVQIEAVNARIRLSNIPAEGWTITPLGPDGVPSGKARPLSEKTGEIVIHSTDKTMWYLISRP